MNRRIRSFLAILAVATAATQFSCSTTLSRSLRDAAISGAAGFVETTTAELLNRWLGSQE